MNEKRETILAAMNARYACKKFDPTRRVSDDDFTTIMEAARLSPSSFGFEPWHFLLVTSETIKEALLPMAWGAHNSLSGASHFLIVLARKQVRYDSPYITARINKLPLAAQASRLQFFKNFQEHDFHLLDNEQSLFDWSAKQTYIAMANMMTTAAFLGIDSCPIEGFDRNAVENLLATTSTLDMQAFGVSYMLSFGYRDEAQLPKYRLPLSETFTVI